jgi:ribose/xylose/arabinose/galactoside ABC-type transport system permease subunit
MAAAPPPPSSPSARIPWLRFGQRTEWGLLVAIVVVVLLTGLFDSQHTYFTNPRPSAVDILRQTALLGIFTLGAAIVIIAGGIDLSSGSVIAFSGTICATILVLLAPDEMHLKVKWFRLDAEAMNRLEQERVPAKALAALQPLKGQTFTTEEAFRQAVRERLAEDRQLSPEAVAFAVAGLMPPAARPWNAVGTAAAADPAAEARTEARAVAAAGFNKPLGIGVLALAIAGTLLVGFLIGSLHAWLITVVGLPPFVATLATLVGLRSFGRAIVENVTQTTWEAKSTQIQIFDERFRYLATSVWIPVVLFAVLAAAAWLLLSRTVVGRHLHALGGNEQAARLSGIRTDRLKWLAYCLSAVLASVAGVLYIGAEAVADPQRQGLGYELNAIAASVVGGCSLQGGVGTISGAVLGALFLRVVIDGVAKMIKTGADVYEGLIVGSVVVVAVAFTQLRQAGRRGKRFFGGALGVVAMLNLSLLAGGLAALVAPKTALGVVGVAVLAAGATLVVLLLVRVLEARAGERSENKSQVS